MVPQFRNTQKSIGPPWELEIGENANCGLRFLLDLRIQR